MDDIDRTFERLKTPIYNKIDEELRQQGIIMNAEMIAEWLQKNSYTWTYEDFLRERKARILRQIKIGRAHV